ncbi:GABA/polyamine transporter [Paraconiothyrium brasiliense]|uniref:GABA/polyamine transporter n=1 Tax=Paraconiothyrium brasiliense TaxID=300254 RepID=A0ABR3RHE4_9PLEO
MTAAAHKHVSEEPVTSVLPGGDVPFAQDGHEFSADEEVLAALGYKSEFKREFSLFTTFCVSFAVLGLLPSFASTLYYGMGYAGTAVNYGTAAMILAAASIQNPSYVPEDYHTFLLTTFIMLIHGVMSSLPTKMLARVNTIGSTFNILALIVVLILIPAGTDRTDRGLPRFTPSSEVWGDIYAGTSFPPGISVLMSFVAVIWTMSGYDSPFHLAEECSNANIASPRAIVLTSAVGGTFGWFLQLIVAYTVVSIDDVLNSDLGQPFAAYLIQCMPKKMVLAILSLTIIAGFSMGQGCMIAASRVTFAYARDDCFPGSKYWKRVNKTTLTPVNAVWFNCVIGILSLLLIFGGSVSIGALFSIGAIAAFVAFTIPIFIRVFFVGDRFRAGPWNLGRLSLPIGAIASGFVLLMVPILCLPSVTGDDLTLDLMNWTSLVYGALMLMVLIWWFVSARKWFKGPKVNVEHLMLGREPNVLEGTESEGEVGTQLTGVGSMDKKIAGEN